jgi:arginine-tRNA-protein transferase
MDPHAIRAVPLTQLPLRRGPAHACPYLPGKTAVNEYTFAPLLPPQDYLALMDRGFRRSGEFVYRPVCDGCRECVPIRVPVARFAPSRSQRRVQKRNTDVRVLLRAPEPTAAKYELFVRYLRYQHDGSMSEGREDFEDFLYKSPTQSLEMTYTVLDRIIAVGILDLCPTAISSVYFYFDPDESWRSPGIFGGLCEIEECRRRGLPYWYLGFYVNDCARMNYKAAFRPHQILDRSMQWVDRCAT